MNLDSKIVEMAREHVFRSGKYGTACVCRRLAAEHGGGEGGMRGGEE